MMQLSSEATDEDVAAIIAALRSLPEMVPEIRSYSVGRDAGLAEGNFDIALVADFDDQAGYKAYAQNPDHLAVIAARIRPFLAGRSAVQYAAD